MSDAPPGFTVDQDAPVPAVADDAPPPGFTVDHAYASAPTKSGPAHPVLNAAAKVAGDFAESPVKTYVGSVENLLSGVTGGAGSLADAVTGADPGTHDWAYRPRTDAGKDIANLSNQEGKTVSSAYDDVFGTGPAAQTWKERLPEAIGAVGTVLGVKGGATSALDSAGKSLVGGAEGGLGSAGDVAPTAEDALAAHAAKASQNSGAAVTPPDLTKADPQLKQAIVEAGQKQDHTLNIDAINRHIEASSLPLPEGTSPLRLRKGQASQDPQQISDEKNLRADEDTQGLLTESINDQNNKLGMSMGEIRRAATPDIVQRSTLEHGQSAIDAIKAQDNAATQDIRAKYKALSDQNGGSMPIDTGATLDDIKGQLAKKFLTKTAAANPSISEVMDAMETGRPMTFEDFENARTNLAEVQRGGGSEAKAAAVVREALESMPLTPEAAQLKGLANAARNAAKARFQVIEQNPAYKAAIEDNTPKDMNGLHVVGAPSPLADSFMDRYFTGNGTNASRAYIARIKGVMQNNPDFAPAVEASTLNSLRSAAGLDSFDTGNFRNDSFKNERARLDKKADVLMSPESVANTDLLQRVSGYVNNESKASSTNRSNTALTLQRFGAVYPSEPTLAGQVADIGADIAAAKAGPVGVVGKRLGMGILKNKNAAKQAKALKDAKLKFAQDATAPGAGISIPKTAKASGGRIGRASGGRAMDHEELTNRLFNRWKAAKKATDKTTEPLLKVPDDAIIRALDIAQEHV